MMTITRISLSLATLAALCQGLSIVPCTTNGTVSVEEHSKDFVLGCDNLNMQHQTSWSFRGRHPMDPQELVSVCSRTSTTPWSCASNYSVMILSTINEHTRRSHVILPDVIRERFPDGTWRCDNGASSPAAECAVDVIYTPRDVQCHLTVDENQATVGGTCQMSKMFSSQGHYSCQWFEKNGSQTEAEISNLDTQFTRNDCSVGSTEYWCGNCSFSKLLPFVSESYSYRAMISPGSVSPSIAYTIVKRNANSVPSSQVAPSASVTRVTSTQSVTSSGSHSSPNSGFTGTRPSPSPPIVVVDEDVIHSARYEGFGIGVAFVLVLLILIITLVVVFFKCRRKRRKEQERENIPNSIVNMGYDAMEFSGGLNSTPHPGPPLPPPFPPSFMSRDSDGGYTSIATPFGRGSDSYLVPVGEDVRKSSTSEKIALGDDYGKGDNKPRRLPPVPVKNAKQISVTEAVTPSVNGSDVASGGGHDDHAYKTRISLELQPLPPLGYEPMHPPFCTKSDFRVADDDKLKESEKAEEEKENRENEKAEEAEAFFLSSGFQMKDAEYIHMNNSGIPPSKPI